MSAVGQFRHALRCSGARGARRAARTACLVVALLGMPIARGQPGDGTAAPGGTVGQPAATGGPTENQSQPTAGSHPANPAPVGIRAIAPELFYLQDDAGRLVPVPGFRYRDFVELFRLREGLPAVPQPAAAVLEEVTVRVGRRDRDGTSPVTVSCGVRQTRDGWVSVPLELPELVLSAPPRHDGPGRLVIAAEPRQAGLRAWLEATADARSDLRHRIELEGRVSVDTSPRCDSIALHLPTATASRLEIASPRSAPEVAVSPVQQGRQVSVAAADDGSTVTVAGLSGAVCVRVSDKGRLVADVGVPEVEVESVVHVDGRNAVISAVLRLAHLDPAARIVRVTPPTGAVLRAVRGGTWIGGGASGDAGAVAEIALDGHDGTTRIELECERAIDSTGATPFEAVGFSLTDVPPWRQWGRMSLVVQGEWQAEWEDENDLRRIDPPVAVRQAGLVATFAFDAQPASLPVRIRPRRSRVVIEPEYRYDVAMTRVGLEGRLRVAVAGAPATGIVVDLDPAWAVDEVGPAGLVDIAAVSVERGRVSIPFHQPLSGDAVIDLRASLPLAGDADRLGWRLPVPRADLVGPASVFVTSASDIELLPDSEAIRGLERQVTASLPPAAGDQPPLLYRLDATDGSFAAVRRLLPRRIEAAVVTLADVAREETLVEQVIELQVAHVPLESLDLLVPRVIAESGTLELRQDGAPLEASEHPPAAADQSAGEGPQRLRVALAVPLLGRGLLGVRYRLPTPRVPADTPVQFSLPLVLPEGTRVLRQSLEIRAAEPLLAEVRGDAWKREPGAAAAPAVRTWSAPRKQSLAILAITARGRGEATGLVVEAAWLQSRLGAGRRDDHYAYALGGAAERVSLVLPPLAPGATRASCDVSLGGVPVPAATSADGRVVVDLPAAAARGLLEIRTVTRGIDRSRALALPASVLLAAPVFDGDVRERRFFWEVYCLPDEHLVGAPAGWTSQQTWSWKPSGPVREANVSTAEIAGWVRASGGAADPPGSEPPLASRRVVFSGVGSPGRAILWLVPHWALVLGASGMALAAGLAAIRCAWLRRPPLVFGAVTLVTLAAAALPDAAVPVLIAAVPGVGLALAAGLAEAASGWRLRRQVAPAVVTAAADSSLTRQTSPSPSLSMSIVVAESAVAAGAPIAESVSGSGGRVP